MAENIVFPADPKDMYPVLESAVAALKDARGHVISTLANTAALVYEALGNVNWAGFYILHDGALLLGPFVGKVACIDIPLSRGVCGACARTDSVQLVPDVHEFPGHIACDSASASELVIPVHASGKLVAVLDIDSPLRGRFTKTDAEGMQKIAQLLEDLDWADCGYRTGV